MFRRSFLFIALLLALVAPVSAQTITSTTSTGALTASATSFQVASATGFAVGNLVAIDREFMTVMSVTGNVIRVGERGGEGTAAGTHPTGSRVYTGSPAAFKGWDLAHPVVLRSQSFDLDNGAAATLDSIFAEPRALTIMGCKLIYEETAGTVAAGNIRIGTSAGGQQVVALTAYTNAAAAGTVTPLNVVGFQVPAFTTLRIQHTGVAATAAGRVVVTCDVSVH